MGDIVTSELQSGKAAVVIWKVWCPDDSQMVCSNQSLNFQNGTRDRWLCPKIT